MNTESVIASPATTSTAPSPSTLIATRGSCAHGKVCRWPLSRSMRTSSACTSLANSVASTVRDGPLGSPWYKVILMSPAPAAVRLFEDRDALNQVGPSQGPACLGGGARIDGTQPPQYVRRQLVVGQRRLGQRQRIGKIEPVDVGEAVLIAGEPRPIRKLLLQHADAERHAALGLLELLFGKLSVDRLAPGNPAFLELTAGPTNTFQPIIEKLGPSHWSMSFIHQRTRQRSRGSSGMRRGPGNSSLTYSMIAVDSVSTRSPCSIAGIVPCGLMAR